MFQMITPSQGDQIIILPNCGFSAVGYQLGFYHKIAGTSSLLGMRPYTWGADRFNNKNCKHFNVKGSVLCINGLTGLSLKDGPSVYTSPSYSSLKPYYKVMGVGTNLVHDIHYPRTNQTDTIVYYVYDLLLGWVKFYREQSIWWRDDLHYRVTVRSRRTAVSTGKVTSTASTCIYHELNSAMTRYRQFTTTATPFDYVFPEWISTYGKWYAVARFTLTGTPIPSPLTPAYLYARLKKWRRKVCSYDSSSYGQLSIDAVQALKVFDGQLSLLLRDLIGFKSTILSFWKGLTSRTLKGASTAYLSYRYGLNLTVRDVIDLLTRTRSSLDGKKGYNTSRSRIQRPLESVAGLPVMTSTTYSMKLYVRDYPDWIIEIFQKLMVADFFPTMELVWDIIPFSFVVDWFVPIGDYLEMIDSRTLISTFKVLSCVTSRKSTIQGQIEEIFPDLAGVYFGAVEISDYVRHVSSTPPPFALDYSTPKSFNHWLEAATLVAQRGRV